MYILIGNLAHRWHVYLSSHRDAQPFQFQLFSWYRNTLIPFSPFSTFSGTTPHCKKKETVSALLRDIALHMADDSLSSERNIFSATQSVFLHQIDRGALPSTRRGFFPAYRMGIGKNSDMVGKTPTCWEKFLLGDGTWSEKFPHRRKNSHIVGKIPT
jgi:hypothetical protein